MTWLEYFKKNGWTKSAAFVRNRKSGELDRVEGRWNSDADYQPGVVGSLPLVLDLPEAATPIDTHGAGFVDQGVLDEWAAAEAPRAKLEPATEAIRDLARYLSRDGRGTFATEVIAPWTTARKPDEEPPARGGALDRIEDLEARVARLEAFQPGADR